MKTKAEKEFDKWIREFVGIQDEYLFQKGTLVRTVAIKYAEFIASQPSDVSDEDIEKYYTHRSDNPPYTDIKNINAIKGAKAMRDGQIKPTIEGEIKCDVCGEIMKLVDSKSFWQCINCGNTRAK